MTDKTLERLRAELQDWRASLEHLRVQANLGEKDGRDKLRELEERLTPAFDAAKERLSGIVESGTDEARAVATSLRSGWEEVRRKHRELAREAERAKTRKRNGG